MNDEQLVHQFQKGSEKAFDELVARYQVKVLNTCFRYLNNKEDARDATQDVFLKIYHALPRFKPKARFSTWLYRIAVNHSLNALRSQKRRRLHSLDSLLNHDNKMVQKITTEASDIPDHKIKSEERLALVQAALAKLGPAQRTAVILHRFEGLSYKEIADVMGTSVSAVESRLFRAKKNLYKLLKPHL